ncbi:2-succinylbenzoate--CoA ligase [Candidatus Viridilinea mediisalina]|uniref:2-succinylbenzoate--CoA ligase n=2 Tax=Candidatus Viridilinea mediisalina TaxID=2024553 RepID=A0A2A6RFK2_9CHLR|nr:2-succinylbenzoate--CoA ligase [Candidatus Viridilinea mediisalina]
MTLLQVVAEADPERKAIVSEHESLSYHALWQQAEALACALQQNYGLQAQQNVALICRNHPASIKALFGCARLGTNIYLVNPEQSAGQLLALIERLGFTFVIHDPSLTATIAQAKLGERALPTHYPSGPALEQLAQTLPSSPHKLKRTTMGRIVVLTSGSTGQPKVAARRPSPLNVIPPFIALLKQAKLHHYRSIYLAPPIYHGYGLAMLFIATALGQSIHITERFNAAQACDLIAQAQIETTIVLPIMLQRMLDHDAPALNPLRCIIAGSAPLAPTLASATLSQLGPILYNLYGSSEAGFALMATPAQLAQKPNTVGQPLLGVRTRIVKDDKQDAAPQQIGELLIRSAWSINAQDWIATGDLAYRDSAGDLFICGRSDDMVVSGGEKVYPIELEQILQTHPHIAAVVVVGIPDPAFGQRLKAVIVCKANQPLDEEALRTWLKPRIARYHMPAVIEFRTELPYTPLGKVDKRLLI